MPHQSEDKKVQFYKDILRYGEKNILNLSIKSDSKEEVVIRIFTAVHYIFNSIIILQQGYNASSENSITVATATRSLIEYLAQLFWMIYDSKKFASRTQLYINHFKILAAINYAKNQAATPKAIDAIAKNLHLLKKSNEGKIVILEEQNVHLYWFRGENKDLKLESIVLILEEGFRGLLPEQLAKTVTQNDFNIYSQYSQIVHGAPTSIYAHTRYNQGTQKVELVQGTEFMEYYRSTAALTYAFTLVLVLGFLGKHEQVRELDGRFSTAFDELTSKTDS